jgi:hypothetical protein
MQQLGSRRIMLSTVKPLFEPFIQIPHPSPLFKPLIQITNQTLCLNPSICRAGIIPLFLNRDIGGPMGRTVEDVARVFQHIVSADLSLMISSWADASKGF